MGLTEISSEDLNLEKVSLEKLFQCCDMFESVVFNSGAGAGKTYALVECLKYIISKNREILNNHNQKIACITYTNVAAKHVQKQIGASDVVEISTIHDRIWSIIGQQKNALLSLHIEKLKNEISEIESQLQSSPDYNKYRELDENMKERFFRIMYDNREVYNKYYNCGASDFRNSLLQLITREYSDLLSNVSKFKGLVDKLFKHKRYVDCLKKIEQGENGYKVVKYDAMYNRDRLDKMRISHDTLLEYGFKLVARYPKMRQLIIDQYPYILIDEYQDTADVVIKILNLLEKYAKEIKHNIFIAYFGDSVQNIYDTGVGKRLNQLHSGLVAVDKIYNRRSYCEIIDVANKVRFDEIVQKSIFLDSKGGSTRFYHGSPQEVKDFINLCEEKWKPTEESPLHCLFATNQMVAEYSGFLNMYETFKMADAYQGSKHEQLNSELLSHDTVHLGKVQSILYRLMKLYTEIREEKIPLRNIIPTNDYRNISFTELKALIEILRSTDGDTIDDLLINVFEQYSIAKDKTYKLIIDSIFDVDDETSYETVKKYFLTSLYSSWNESDDPTEIISPLLNISVQELLNWFHYINRDEKKRICYHTFHSTKGLEFENVIVILGKDFGVKRDLFENFFINYGKNEETLSDKYEKGRNILYVTVTRAIKNLRIFYVDDLDNMRVNVEKIFGKIYPFSKDMLPEAL